MESNQIREFTIKDDTKQIESQSLMAAVGKLALSTPWYRLTKIKLPTFTFNFCFQL